MALTSYAGLTAAFSSWEERTFTSSETDDAIVMAEAKANRKLLSDWRMRSSSTVATDSSSVGTIPTGFVGLVSITRDVSGSVPLRQVPLEALTNRNPYGISADAEVFALLNSTQFQVSPVTEDDFIIAFDSTLPALSSSNTSNWLLSLAPDYYLFAGQAALCAKIKDYQTAALLQAQADDILDAVISMGNVAELAHAEMTLLDGMNPP